MEKLPELMTAIEISTPGGPEVLIAAERPVPSPGDGELLLKVAFAGVNRPDVIQRKGLYPPPPGASDLPGLEVSGVVVSVGAGVSRELLGTRQCALVSGGGYAEYCIARADAGAGLVCSPPMEPRGGKGRLRAACTVHTRVDSIGARGLPACIHGST